MVKRILDMAWRCGV